MSNKSIENEIRLISGAFYNHEWATEIVNRITPTDLECPTVLQIWRTIDYLVKNDSEVTFSKIIDLIKPNEVLYNELLKFTAYSSGAFELQGLIALVKEASLLRKLRILGTDFVNQIDKANIPADLIIRQHEEQLFATTQSSLQSGIELVSKGLKTPRPMVEMLEERIERNRRGLSSFDGIPTGFKDLDRLIQGFSQGHLVVIGARPMVGKTSMLTMLVQKMAFNSGAKSLVFSLEMPKKELLEKIISQTARISLTSMRNGTLLPDHLEKVKNAIDSWHDKIVLLDDQPSLSIDQIKSRSIRIKRSYDINIIFIDYLQLITSKQNAERHLEIADISRRLKEIAKELNVSVVALAQLNRKMEERAEKRPMLSDLRESGAIEADADEVLLLHRPEIYKPDEKIGLIEVHVAKNRFGPIGKFDLSFEKESGFLGDYYAKRY